MNFGPFTRTHFARFAAATNDYNPIHLDDEVAQAAGLPSVVGSGLVAAAVIAEAANVPRESARLSVRFRMPILPGMVLECHHDDNGGYEVHTGDGTVVAVGRVEVLTHERGTGANVADASKGER